ncbi:hypothetical protein GBA52_003302 [Prunus armeniaca]|nr:hypothetical protein GBA52_003302 [Prunus armeniaca]
MHQLSSINYNHLFQGLSSLYHTLYSIVHIHNPPLANREYEQKSKHTSISNEFQDQQQGPHHTQQNTSLEFNPRLRLVTSGCLRTLTEGSSHT